MWKRKMGRPQKIFDRTAFVILWKGGVPVKEIAEAFLVSERTVYRLARKFGMYRNKVQEHDKSR